MIIDFFNRGGGGGGTAQYATSAGTADNSKLLDGIQSFPQSANTGDVVAINGEPLRGGMRSPIPQIEAGVYQYDGSDWNKVGDGETPDFTSLMPVSEFPESAETGEVVALEEHTEGLPYGITFNEMDYNGGDIQGRRLIVPFGSLDELGEGDLVFLGNVGPVGGSAYELNISNADGVYALTYEDPNDPLLSIYTNEEGSDSSNGVMFEYYISGSTYVIDIYPDVNETNEIVFTEVPEDSDVVGIYQYDGSSWNKVGGGSSAYKIELSTSHPDAFTSEDEDALNDFFAAVEEDPSIAYTAYIYADNCVYSVYNAVYDSEEHNGGFSFSFANSNWIDEINLSFQEGEYSSGYHYEWNGNSLIPNDFPSDPVEGQIANTVTTLNPRPEAPDLQTVYGGDYNEFCGRISENGKTWVSTWEDESHSGSTTLGYFYLENYQLGYYDYQSGKQYTFDEFPIGEWTPDTGFGGVYVRRDGENVYFCVWREAGGVFFTNDVDMIFEDAEIEYQMLYKWNYNNGEWKRYPYALYSNDEQPIGLDTGDVYSAPYYVQTETITLDYATIISDIQNGDYSYFECFFNNHSNHFYVAGNGHFEWQGIKLTGTTDTNIVLIDDNGDPIQGLTDGTVIGSLVNGEVFVQYDEADGVITIIVNRADWDGSADIPEGKDQEYVDEMCGGKDTETENGYAVYQIAENAESKTIVSVTFPNGYEDGNRYVSGYMEILIKKWPEQSAIVTTAEFMGSRYRFMVDDANNEDVTVYDDNDDKVLILTDGNSDSFILENENSPYSANCVCTFNDKVFRAEVEGMVVGWENTKNITEKFYSNYVRPLAFKDELPNKNQLIPTNWNAAELLMSNGVGVEPIWYPRDRVLVDAMEEAFPYDENNGVQFLARKSYFEVGWEKVDTSTLSPKDNLPVQAEEGTAFSNSNDGIVQAQGTTADTSNLYEIEMKNAWQIDIVGVKGLVVSGITTADRFVFRFDGDDDTHFVWNGSGWEVENFEIDSDNGNGEISGHTTLSSTAVTIGISYDSNDGCYYFAFDRGWVQYYVGNDSDDFSTSTVWVRDLPVTQYKNAVMSSTIKEIVKCTQAEYDALLSGGTVDNNTFYVIIANPV